MDRDLWSGLAVFETIVEAGSFARAATRLGLSASALSHAMRSLETKLGVRLLDRTTRSLAPTLAGEELLARLKPAIASVAACSQSWYFPLWKRSCAIPISRSSSPTAIGTMATVPRSTRQARARAQEFGFALDRPETERVMYTP